MNQNRINKDVRPTLRATMEDNLPAVSYEEPHCFPSAGFGEKAEENVASTILTDHDNRVTSSNAALICYPINSMVLGKDIKNGDRQTTGIGKADDPCPTISTKHHHVIAEVIAIDGDKIGKKERKGGSGFGINEDNVMYTQTVKDVHAVAYSQVENVSPTLAVTHGESHAVLLRNKENEMNHEEVKSINCQGGSNINVCDGRTETVTAASNSSGNNMLGVVESRQDEVKALYSNGNGYCRESDAHSTLSTGGGQLGQGYPAARINATVRRLMPIETERLMGFPDNWTRIKWDGMDEEDCPDAPRYKACGNSFCANCIEWIGRRIELVEKEIQEGR